MEAPCDDDHFQQLAEFPCAFNMASSEKVTRSRLKATLHNLQAESRFKDDYECEVIRKNNLLAWIWFHLEKKDESERLCNDVVDRTKSRNVASLGNMSFIYWYAGKEIEALKCIKTLQELKKQKDFRELQTEAKAEQAYYYSRLGGPDNVLLAIKLFSEAVAEIPDNCLWRFGLGLLCRRATNTNIFCSSREEIDVGKCKKMAVENLMEVADKGDNRLKAMAFAQLVNLRLHYSPGTDTEIDALFRHLDVRELCDRALSNGETVPSVLTHCGNALREIDVDKSIRLLEKSIEVKGTSMARHFLGLSYICKYKAQLLEQNKVNHHNKHSANTNTHLSGDHAAAFIPAKPPDYESTDAEDTSVCAKQFSNQFDINDPLVQKAIECLKTAVRVGEGCNFPALLDLGLLLKQAGQTVASLTQFNKVTNSPWSLAGHKLTVIKALEQAGICCLEMGQGEACQSNQDYGDMGKMKLTKAISLAADLALTMPELKDSAEEIWAAFRMLDNEIDKEPTSIHQHKKKIKLLELLRNHGRIIEVVQRIKSSSEEDLIDEDIIKATLISYLKLDQPASALAFHNCIAVQAAVRDSSWWHSKSMRNLRAKVLLQTIYTVLKDKDENPSFMFQQLFELCFGSCIGRGSVVNNRSGNPKEEIGDVLVVFEDGRCRDEDPDVTLRLSRCLKSVATSLFGLAAEENLQVG